MPVYNEVLIQKNVAATMRDGTTLLANLYRPAAAGSYPVLLMRLPYGKDLGWSTGYLDPVKLAQNGFIVAIQDVRGCWASEGEWAPFEHEREDGFDSVQWAAELEGSDGQVGMWGASYFGITQWQAAVMQPHALRAIAPCITWGNFRNGCHFRGGARELGLLNYWANAALALNSLTRKFATDPGEIVRQLPNVIQQIDTVPQQYTTLPLLELPDPLHLNQFVFNWLQHPLTDRYWDDLNIEGRYERVTIPVLNIGGWYDIFLGETLHQYEVIKEQAARAGTHAPRLVIGPWTHGLFGNVVGDLDFGLVSSGLLLNYRGSVTDLHIRWFDATLRGNGGALANDPPVEVFVMGENRWRSFAEWPVPDATLERWFFHSGGHANTRGGDGTLGRVAPADEPDDQFRYDPADPVPTVGGALLMPAAYRAGPRDQGVNEDRVDVLCYTSAALDRDYTVIGPVTVTLYAASSAPDTDWVARLVDVYPDGRAINLTDGIVRASARESYRQPAGVTPIAPQQIEPERVYEYLIDLWATANTFKTGHCIRVEVTSSNFPRWDRNLNTGTEGVSSSVTAVALQTIKHDNEHPSHVMLVVVG